MKLINEQINASLLNQAKKLAQYTRLLHEILPIECRNHVEVANIRDRNLMLISDSPVWTTRLRQLSPKILQFISQNSSKIDKTLTIHHIQIKTRYHAANLEQQQSSSQKPRPKPEISEKTADLLVQSANSINDPKLKTSLLNIASHRSGKNNHKNNP